MDWQEGRVCEEAHETEMEENQDAEDGSCKQETCLSNLAHQEGWREDERA